MRPKLAQDLLNCDKPLDRYYKQTSFPFQGQVYLHPYVLSYAISGNNTFADFIANLAFMDKHGIVIGLVTVTNSMYI